MYSAEKPDEIERFFRGLTEHAFHARLGIFDPLLVEYLADLLIRSIRSDQLAGARIDLVSAELLAEAFDAPTLAAMAPDEAAAGEEFRLIGDSALFWTGIYPEALDRPHGLPTVSTASAGPPLVTYRLVGKRAYRLASTFSAGMGPLDRELFERLSDEFDLCVEGLAEVRRAWGERA